jgi:hypothetical protein
LERKLGDNDERLFLATAIFDVHLSANENRSSSGGISFGETIARDNFSSCD